jgi:hypothetical protein
MFRLRQEIDLAKGRGSPLLIFPFNSLFKKDVGLEGRLPRSLRSLAVTEGGTVQASWIKFAPILFAGFENGTRPTKDYTATVACDVRLRCTLRVVTLPCSD